MEILTLKYAKSFKVRISISTNLNHFNNSICSDLVLSGLDEVVVSLDGTSQESVSTYQVGNDFNKVVANIVKLANCKKNLNKKKPIITWRFLVNRYNENEIGKFKNVSIWLPTNESLSYFNYAEKTKRKIKNCRWLWLQSSINWNGSVAPCCAVWHEKYDFGNIQESSFKIIWNSAKYREARKISKKKSIKSEDNICSICYANKSII